MSIRSILSMPFALVTVSQACHHQAEIKWAQIALDHSQPGLLGSLVLLCQSLGGP